MVVVEEVVAVVMVAATAVAVAEVAAAVMVDVDDKVVSMMKSQGKSAHSCQHQRDINESIVSHINTRAYRIERSRGA